MRMIRWTVANSRNASPLCSRACEYSHTTRSALHYSFRWNRSESFCSSNTGRVRCRKKLLTPPNLCSDLSETFHGSAQLIPFCTDVCKMLQIQAARLSILDTSCSKDSSSLDSGGDIFCSEQAAGTAVTMSVSPGVFSKNDQYRTYTQFARLITSNSGSPPPQVSGRSRLKNTQG